MEYSVPAEYIGTDKPHANCRRASHKPQATSMSRLAEKVNLRSLSQKQWIRSSIVLLMLPANLPAGHLHLTHTPHLDIDDPPKLAFHLQLPRPFFVSNQTFHLFAPMQRTLFLFFPSIYRCSCFLRFQGFQG